VARRCGAAAFFAAGFRAAGFFAAAFFAAAFFAAAFFAAGGRPNACAAMSSADWAVRSTAALTEGRNGAAFFAAGLAVCFFAAGFFAAGVFSLRRVAIIVLLESRFLAPDGPAVSCGPHTRAGRAPVASPSARRFFERLRWGVLR
jgi:hypothetical protein